MTWDEIIEKSSYYGLKFNFEDDEGHDEIRVNLVFQDGHARYTRITRICKSEFKSLDSIEQGSFIRCVLSEMTQKFLEEGKDRQLI